MQNFAEFSIFTFSSRFLFILFLCFFGELLPVHFMLLACDWGNFYSSKSKSVLLSGSKCCSLCHLTTVSMLQLPLYLLPTLLLSVLLSLLVICTKYSRPASKCGCTSRPSTSCYSPTLLNPLPPSLLNSMCTLSAKSNEIFAACD